MRALVILVCGVLLSVQGFAVRGVAGKNSARQLKDLLHNHPLMKAVAAELGGTSVAINSRILDEVLDSKQPIERYLVSAVEDLGVDMKSVLSTMTKAVDRVELGGELIEDLPSLDVGRSGEAERTSRVLRLQTLTYDKTKDQEAAKSPLTDLPFTTTDLPFTTFRF